MKIDTNLYKLPDVLLLDQTEFLVQQERETTIMILRHLRKIEVRRLYIELGYSSMHKYCIHRLKYSEGQAYRRISSARLLIELPEIEKQIHTGDLNLTNLSKIQSFVRTEKTANYHLDKNEKLDLIASLENKSTREVERELVKKSHQPLLLAEKFHMTEQELSLLQAEQGKPEVQYQRFETLLTPEQQNLLQDFKNFYAHELKDLSNHSILLFLLENAVNLKRKKHGLQLMALQLKTNSNAPLPSAAMVDQCESRQDEGATSENSLPENRPKVPVPSKEIRTESKRISSQRKPLKMTTKRLLWQRAEGCCEYIDPKYKKRCSSKFALEEDHIQPVALGGTNDIDNLQLLCQAHNSRRAAKTFGVFRKKESP